ncbi:hypothetical protein STEG23_009483 [Scotinomys teguina]
MRKTRCSSYRLCVEGMVTDTMKTMFDRITVSITSNKEREKLSSKTRNTANMPNLNTYIQQFEERKKLKALNVVGLSLKQLWEGIHRYPGPDCSNGYRAYRLYLRYSPFKSTCGCAEAPKIMERAPLASLGVGCSKIQYRHRPSPGPLSGHPPLQVDPTPSGLSFSMVTPIAVLLP